ncbi:hypothetical protein ASPVEDRAFT_88545 [Aspergillus versicolor CBS 583.65]|uniref:MOSC domain-containing protein n=1 Tax=Aspergillus versicolor CBS 583.65 TaxID=1036611 RepID=A0A1L9Q0T6_ASPVE|nr:uncharacterized protein ASPVEDRAFT_88545 [Aspergillus versicolor CBS 583.65]OJJ07292.1 hypothetical protein ASPVEDRAFT_88545 [Aspergillus versicolor CBS 583.65]
MLLQAAQAVLALETSTFIYSTVALTLLLSVVFAAIVNNGVTASTRRQLRNLHRLGLPSNKSNMADQYDSKYAIAEDDAAQHSIRIKSIYIHPVKSCGPVEVHRALLTKTGFLYDRCFAIATVADGKWRFISQRTKPAMALIATELWLPHKHSDASDPLVQAGGCLVLRFQDPNVRAPSWTDCLESLFYNGNMAVTPEVSAIVPLEPPTSQQEKYQIEQKTFTIHGRDTSGLDMSTVPSVADALPKLKRFLGLPATQPLALLRCNDDSLTRTNKNLAPLEHIGSPSVHAYTDQQPVNINSLSSVQAVSSLLPSENQPLDALRFRANLWITGAPAYAEETWKRCRVRPSASATKDQRASVAPSLSVVCRTSRCTMPNVDTATGTFETDLPPEGKKKGKPQPSTTLVDYRTVETGNKSALGYLGMHCVPEDRDLKDAEAQGKGLYVEVGDEIEVLERGVHLYGSTGDDY